MPPHTRHGGSSSPARTRSRVSCIGPRQPQSRHFASCVVPWISTTISGDEPARWCRPSTFWVTSGVQRGAGLEVGERAVTGVRLGVPHGPLDPVAPRLLPELGIGDVVPDVGAALGRRVLRPHALRPAEVGDARLGRDPRAGEHDDLPGVPQPLPRSARSPTRPNDVSSPGASGASGYRRAGRQRATREGRAARRGGDAPLVDGRSGGRAGRESRGSRSARERVPRSPARAPRSGGRRPTARSRGTTRGGSPSRAARVRRGRGRRPARAA